VSAGSDILDVMRDRRSIRGFPVFGLAAAGVVLGHWLAYRVSIPSEPAREQVLVATGHGYWVLIVKLAVAMGLAGAGAVFVQRLAARGPDPRPGLEAYTWLVFRLAGLQIVAFTAMETVERVANGVPLGGLFTHHLFVYGLAVQFLVACCGALVLLGLSRAAGRLAHAVRSGPYLADGTGAAPLSPVEALLVARAPAGAFGIRGPPRS
jgi:hypothetical protein